MAVNTPLPPHPLPPRRSGRPALNGLSRPGRLAMRAAGAVTAVGFGTASRLRGAKAFHPQGTVYEATVAITGAAGAPADVPLLSEPAERPALIRFSRGAGLPRPLPDVLGMAIRLIDAHGEGRHQDLLLVTSGDGAVIQHLLLPARRWDSLPYSSLIPYRVPDGGLILFGARRRQAPGWNATDDREQLARVAADRSVAFDLGVAPVGGRLAPVGEILLGDRLPAGANAIRFNPFNTGGGLEPATVLNRLRDYAYPASQTGWAGAAPAALADQ